MNIKKLILAVCLILGPTAYGVEDANSLQNFIKAKQAEILEDEKKIIILKESIRHARVNREAANALDLADAGVVFIGIPAVVIGVPSLFVAGYGSDFSNEKLFKLGLKGLKVAGVLILTTATVGIGDMIYMHVTESQLVAMNATLASIEKSIPARKAELEQLAKNINN